MTTTRAIAVAAYAAAVASPVSVDWRSVADMLHAALPAVRGVLKSEQTPDSTAPRWFADWKLGKVYSLDSLAVRFADGHTVRVNLAKAPGKLPRIAAACRVAVAFYRAATGRDAVPAFASLEALSDGATFDAEACSRLTADLRRTAHVPAAVRPAVTAEAVARMRAEVERRRTGLARILAGDRADIDSNATVWAEAVAAGEAELAHMVDPTQAPCRNFRPRVRPLHVEQPDPAAAWCEAVAGLYGEPAAIDIGDRDEVVLITPPDAMADATPPEAIGKGVDTADPLESDPSYPLVSDDDDGGWQPDAASHPVIALCHSDKARAALFERIQDGTFPADDRTSKGGAFRLTVADALDCQGIGSLRFVGLPRKPYTRRAMPTPLAGIQSPPEAIRIPAAAFLTVGTPPGPVVYHAAPQL